MAALGPKNVELAAELAEAWMPVFYLPERSAAVWGDALADGQAKRDPSLGPLDVIASAPLAIGDDVTGLRDRARPQLALYIGGMGARGRNFYNDLVRRYGYEAEAKAIQDAYLDGRKAEAEALVPAELIERTSLIGPEGLRGRAGGRLPRGRRHHAQRHPDRAHPRGPGRASSSRSAPWPPNRPSCPASPR